MRHLGKFIVGMVLSIGLVAPTMAVYHEGGDEGGGEWTPELVQSKIIFAAAAWAICEGQGGNLEVNYTHVSFYYNDPFFGGISYSGYVPVSVFCRK